MKRRRVIFILPIISLIVLSLNICSFAMNTGFSTSEPDEKKQQYFLSGNAITFGSKSFEWWNYGRRLTDT